jgi:hypothetical protein
MAREDGVRWHSDLVTVRLLPYARIWQERSSSTSAPMGVPYSNKSGVREDAGLTQLELRTSGELWVLRDHGQGTSRASHTIMSVGHPFAQVSRCFRNHKLSGSSVDGLFLLRVKENTSWLNLSTPLLASRERQANLPILATLEREWRGRRDSNPRPLP